MSALSFEDADSVIHAPLRRETRQDLLLEDVCIYVRRGKDDFLEPRPQVGTLLEQRHHRTSERSSSMSLRPCSEGLDAAAYKRACGGVSPLRGAGLLRCASSRCQRPSVSPLTGGHPSRGLAATLRARWRAGCRRTAALWALPVRSPMQRSRLRLHRDAEQPGQAGDAGVDDDSGPFPCPGIASLGSFTGT